MQPGVLSAEHDDRHVLLIRIERPRHLGHVDDDGVVDQHVSVDVRRRRELLQHRRRRRRVELVDLAQPVLRRRVTGLGDGVVGRRHRVARERRSLERAREQHPAGPGRPHERRHAGQVAREGRLDQPQLREPEVQVRMDGGLPGDVVIDSRQRCRDPDALCPCWSAGSWAATAACRRRSRSSHTLPASSPRAGRWRTRTRPACPFRGRNQGPQSREIAPHVIDRAEVLRQTARRCRLPRQRAPKSRLYAFSGDVSG